MCTLGQRFLLYKKNRQAVCPKLQGTSKSFPYQTNKRNFHKKLLSMVVFEKETDDNEDEFGLH